MSQRDPKLDEMSRIQSVYAERDGIQKSSLYAWHRSEVRVQQSEKELTISAALANALGNDLSNAKILDVGCGNGGFLRTLVDWGAQPMNLIGTEYLEDRLDQARRCSPSGIKWHLGGLGEVSSSGFDLVTTHTVFSSILDPNERLALSREIWRVLKPGGWLLVFDFRYNNPSNRNVHKVTTKELKNYWKEGINSQNKTLLLAPPLARRIIPLSPLLGSLMTKLFPFLRSHFCFMLQKPKL